MYILNFLPGIILMMVLGLLGGLMARLLSEGASFKVAILSILRIVLIPFAFFMIVSEINEKKRKILYDYKKTAESQESIDVMERLLNKKWSLPLTILRISVKFPRVMLDSYIKASIDFEQRKSSKSKAAAKKGSFYDYFMSDTDMEKHIFHS